MPEDLTKRRGNRVHVFIDASNLWAAQKIKGRLINYEKLVEVLKSQLSADEIRVFYYTAYPAEGTRDYDLSGKHKFFTFLNKGLGFVVRKKELKRIKMTNGSSFEEKGNMDVEMTIDAVLTMKDFDTAVLCSGDSDFLALVTLLKQRGKRVFIISSRNNISHELRSGGDGYIEMLDLDESIWGKALKYREQKQ